MLIVKENCREEVVGYRGADKKPSEKTVLFLHKEYSC